MAVSCGLDPLSAAIDVKPGNFTAGTPTHRTKITIIVVSTDNIPRSNTYHYYTLYISLLVVDFNLALR